MTAHTFLGRILPNKNEHLKKYCQEQVYSHAAVRK
jgi:hypothetical protein